MPKAKKAGDLYLASRVHVRRGDVKDAEGKSHPNIVTIEHGQMVSDTDLTPKEVAELKTHPGVLRAPSFEELEAMDSAEEQKASREAAQEVEDERQRLATDQEAERQSLEAEHRSKLEKEKAKLSEQQSKDRAEAEKKLAAKKK